MIHTSLPFYAKTRIISMKFVRIFTKVLLSLLALIIILSGGIFCYLKYRLLTPEQLSELVTHEINRRANVEFRCEK